jgi:hypothetical protein
MPFLKVCVIIYDGKKYPETPILRLWLSSEESQMKKRRRIFRKICAAFCCRTSPRAFPGWLFPLAWGQTLFSI